MGNIVFIAYFTMFSVFPWYSSLLLYLHRIIGGLIMSVTEPRFPVVLPTPPARLHLSVLTDELIDSLVSQHIFKQPRVCTGHAEPGMRLGMRRCLECNATFDEVATSRFYAEPGHLRLVPGYTKDMGEAWSIIDALRWQSRETQVCFVLFLDDLVCKEEIRGKLNGLRSCTKQQLLFGLSARLIAIAALQAIDVITVDGYYQEGRSMQCSTMQ